MKNRIISAFTAVVLMAGINAQAVTTALQPTTYTFGADSAIEEVFKGTATGSGPWNEKLSTFLTMENEALTVSSARKAAFISLKEVEASANAKLSTNLTLSVQNDRSSTTYATGFAFGAAEDGYYQLLFRADGTAAIAKSNSLESAGLGTILTSADVSDKIAFDGTESAAITFSIDGTNAVLSVNDEEAIHYTHTEPFKKGTFGFLTTRDMSAVYENLSLTTDKEVLVYEESDYEITNYDAVVGDGYVTLSWTNPNVPYIRNIVIKDANGKEVAYAGEIDTLALAENSVRVSALSHNVDHSLRLIASFSNGHADTSTAPVMVNIPFTADDYKIADFKATAMIEAAKLSWTNPSAGEISDIAITDEEGNVYDVTVSKVVGAKNEVEIDLQGGTTHTYTVTITFADSSSASASGEVTAVVLEESKYYPKNVLVYESYTRLGLSWINPQKPVKSITITDCATGNGAVYEDELSMAPGAANNVVVKDLSSTEVTNFRITFEFTDGHEAVEYVAGGLAYGKGAFYDYEQVTSTKVTDWNVFHNIQTANYTSIPAYISIDRDEKASGESSIKLVSNYAKAYSNVYMRLYRNLTDYDPAYTYRVSMKVKYENAKDSVLVTYDNSAMNSYADGSNAPTVNVGSNLTPKISSNGWEEVSFIMSPETASGNPRVTGKVFAIQMVSGKTCEAFWIDDIEIVPIDSMGNVIGDSIITNNGLEVTDNEPCGNVKIKAEECSLKDGMAKLVWNESEESQLKAIKVYRESEGVLHECATLAASASGVEIGSIAGDDVRFVIKTVDTSDNVSGGSEITLTASTSKLVIGDITFKYNGNKVLTIPAGASGRINVSISVTNNGADSFEGSIWTAVYKDGILTEVSSSDTTMFAQNSGTKTIETNATISEGCVVKAFFMDNITNMKLLASSAELK